MSGTFQIPLPYNEPTLSYAPLSNERKKLKEALFEAKKNPKTIAMRIGVYEISEGKKKTIHPPHDHKFTLGYYYEGEKYHVENAINVAMASKENWEFLPWEQKANIFLKAADLISGPYRYKINAATMLGQSKNAYQAEIDAACEFADFLRFNVYYVDQIYRMQPIANAPATWNRVEYRPLEGFVYALTPFNFTAIAGNLPIAAAMMGNVVIWKPSDLQVYTADLIMEILQKAGLPLGVINMILVEGEKAAEVIFSNKNFAGIHFTGSTKVFKSIWKTIAKNLDIYNSYPKIVGETGGKDFMIAHSSANIDSFVANLIRGAFEYQGQKCSACSRAYIPKSIEKEVLNKLKKCLGQIKVGSTEDFSCFVNAVIDQKAFNKIVSYIELARSLPSNQIIAGGTYDDSIGYFIQPTVIHTIDPHSITMLEEIFGPVLTIYTYEDNDFKKTLDLINSTSEYALTGSISAEDKYAIALATQKLRNCAGNFYINDKCTGAVVGQQPFGGGRMSGTNDKSGSILNLLRFTSPRTIKENFLPVDSYEYPFLGLEN